jgi:hypothetical protein
MRWRAAVVLRKRVRVVLSALVLFIGVSVLASCGRSTGGSAEEQREARRVAVTWLKAMADSNVKVACGLMDAENHASHPEFPSWSPARNCEERWLHSDNRPLRWKPSPDAAFIWGDSDPKVLEVQIEGDRATVLTEGVGDEGRPVWLRKEHGHWLVNAAEYPI